MRKLWTLIVVIICVVAMPAIAADVFPGVIFYAHGGDAVSGTWTTTASYMAATDQAGTVDLYPNAGYGPTPLVHVAKGGVFAGQVRTYGFDVQPAPSAGEQINLVEYHRGDFYTAGVLRRVTFRFDSPGDRMRFGPLWSKSTITAISQTMQQTVLSVYVYDASGFPVDVFYVDLPPYHLVQATYAGAQALDGSPIAYTFQAVPGCQIGAPGDLCGRMPYAYAFVLSPDDGTGHTLAATYGQSIGLEVSSTQLVAEAVLAKLRATQGVRPKGE